MTDRILVMRQAGGPPPMPLRSPEYLAENLAPHLLAITISLTVLALITVVARFWVRVFILKTFGWDGEFKPLRFADRQPLLTAPYQRRYDDHLSGMFATTPQPLPQQSPQPLEPQQLTQFSVSVLRVWDSSSSLLILDLVVMQKHFLCKTSFLSSSSYTSIR